MTNKTLLAVAAATILTGCGVDKGEPTRSETPPAPPPSSGNETPIRISVEGSPQVNERDGAVAKASIEFVLNREADSDFTIIYSVASADTGTVTATPNSDFTPVQGAEIEIGQGQRRATIEVDVLGDIIDEEDESVIVSIDGVVGVSPVFTNTSYTFAIIDNDPEPQVVFDIAQQIVSEKTGAIEVGVSLTSLTERQVTVPILFSGTANEEQDFQRLFDDTLVFAPLQTSQDLALQVIDDSIPEGGESLTLTLGDITNSTPGEQDSHTVIISGQVGLNDTGVTVFSDGVNFDYQQAPDGFPGQDAESGRDVTVNNPQDGYIGFAYEYLDADGNVIGEGSRSAEAASQAVCVRDRITNLTWEIKQEENNRLLAANGAADRFRSTGAQEYNEDFGLEHSNWRSTNYQYFWFSDDSTNNAGVPGIIGETLNSTLPISLNCAYQSSELSRSTSIPHGQRLPQELGEGRGQASCSTSAYIEEMRRASVCGFTDWRMPTVNELKGVVVYEQQQTANGQRVSVIPSMFPRDAAIAMGEQGSVIDRPVYLTGTPNSENDGSVWCVNTQTGDALLCRKNSTSHVRAIRGGTQ